MLMNSKYIAKKSRLLLTEIPWKEPRKVTKKGTLLVRIRKEDNYKTFYDENMG